MQQQQELTPAAMDATALLAAAVLFDGTLSQRIERYITKRVDKEVAALWEVERRAAQEARIADALYVRSQLLQQLLQVRQQDLVTMRKAVELRVQARVSDQMRHQAAIHRRELMLAAAGATVPEADACHTHMKRKRMRLA